MELFLFTTDVDFAKSAQDAGVDGVIVDWERCGKEDRQRGRDLEINSDMPEDVERLSRLLKVPMIVRINPFSKQTRQEVGCAIEKGANILMLPMAKTAGEVADFLRLVNHRVKTIIQVETLQLVKDVGSLALLKWDYVYIGLNDLMVDRGGRFIWEAVLDGTVEAICRALRGRKYGFGGVTIIGGGEPVPFELLLHEYIHLGCSLCFLRRMFKKEIMDRDIRSEFRAIRSFIRCSKLRGEKAKIYDHDRLRKFLVKQSDFSTR